MLSHIKRRPVNGYFSGVTSKFFAVPKGVTKIALYFGYFTNVRNFAFFLAVGSSLAHTRETSALGSNRMTRSVRRFDLSRWRA